MDSLLDNKAVRRLIKNTLLAQKRFIEAGDLTEESLRDFAETIPVNTLQYWYVTDVYDFETFEALLDYKFNLQGV